MSLRTLIADGQHLLMLGLGTVAGILIYDNIVAPRIRRRILRQAKDDLRAALGAAGGGPPGSPARPAEAGAPSVDDGTSAGAGKSSEAAHRLDEYARTLQEQQRKLDEDRKALMEERVQLETMRRDFESERESMETEAREVAKARATVEARRAMLESIPRADAPAGPVTEAAGGAADRSNPQWSVLEAQARALEAEKEKLAREYADVEARRATLDRRDRALGQQKDELQRERESLLELRKQLAARQESIEQTQKKYAQLLVTLERERTEQAPPPAVIRTLLEQIRREGEALLAPSPDGPADDGATALTLFREFYASFPREVPRSRIDAFLTRLAEEEGLLTAAQVREARDLQRVLQPPTTPIGYLLLRLGHLDTRKTRRIAAAHRQRYGSTPPAEPPAAQAEEVLDITPAEGSIPVSDAAPAGGEDTSDRPDTPHDPDATPGSAPRTPSTEDPHGS
jgi:hypothetical protein